MHVRVRAHMHVRVLAFFVCIGYFWKDIHESNSGSPVEGCISVSTERIFIICIFWYYLNFHHVHELFFLAKS